MTIVAHRFTHIWCTYTVTPWTFLAGVFAECGVAVPFANRSVNDASLLLTFEVGRRANLDSTRAMGASK